MDNEIRATRANLEAVLQFFGSLYISLTLRRRIRRRIKELFAELEKEYIKYVGSDHTMGSWTSYMAKKLELNDKINELTKIMK